MADDGIDVTQMRRLAEDLGRIPHTAHDSLEPIVKAAASDVKDILVEGAKWSEHFHGMARSITYDRDDAGPFSVSYVVGPDKGRRGGALGNIFYFGTSRGGGSGDLSGALATAAPGFRRALAEAAQRWAQRGVSGGGGSSP